MIYMMFYVFTGDQPPKVLCYQAVHACVSPCVPLPCLVMY